MYLNWAGLIAQCTRACCEKRVYVSLIQKSIIKDINIHSFIRLDYTLVPTRTTRDTTAEQSFLLCSFEVHLKSAVWGAYAQLVQCNVKVCVVIKDLTDPRAGNEVFFLMTFRLKLTLVQPCRLVGEEENGSVVQFPVQCTVATQPAERRRKLNPPPQ